MTPTAAVHIAMARLGGAGTVPEIAAESGYSTSAVRRALLTLAYRAPTQRGAFDVWALPGWAGHRWAPTERAIVEAFVKSADYPHVIYTANALAALTGCSVGATRRALPVVAVGTGTRIRRAPAWRLKTCNDVEVSDV